MQNLEGKTIVFFGATGGIGESVCREFQKAGANLVLVARSQDKLAKLKEELGGQNIAAISADATSLTEVQKVFRESNDRFGQVDAVVISVGTWKRTSINNTPEEIIEMNEQLDTSVAKPVIVVGSVAQEFLRKQGRGVIFNISSHAADKYLPGNLAYASAKAKGSRFILNLGEELKGSGVSACDLQPALVDTPQNRKGLPHFSQEDWAKAVQPRDIAEFIGEHIGNSNIPAIKFFESGIEAK